MPNLCLVPVLEPALFVRQCETPLHLVITRKNIYKPSNEFFIYSVWVTKLESMGAQNALLYAVHIWTAWCPSLRDLGYFSVDFHTQFMTIIPAWCEIGPATAMHCPSAWMNSWCVCYSDNFSFSFSSEKRRSPALLETAKIYDFNLSIHQYGHVKLDDCIAWPPIIPIS